MKLILHLVFLIFFSQLAFTKTNSKKFLVETLELKAQEFSFKRRYIGDVSAQYFSLLKVNSSKTVSNIFVKPNEEVKTGQLLISLRNMDEQSAYEVALKTLSLREKELARIKKLYKTGDISKIDLNKAKTAFNEAKSRTLERKIALGSTEIRAPFNGRVGIPQITIGAFVTPNSPIITIQRAPFFITFRVPPQRLSELYVGQKANVLGDINLEAKIDAVEKTIDPGTKTGFARANLIACHTCVTGKSEQIEIIIYQNDNAIVIPKTAIFYKNAKPFVYLAIKKDKKLFAEQREITIGRDQQGYFEIIKGLKKGEIIIKVNPQRLFPNAEITTSSK